MRSFASTLTGRWSGSLVRNPERRRQTEIWIAWVRLLAVPWAVAEVGLIAEDYPNGYRGWAWLTTAMLAAGALLLMWLARRGLGARARGRLGFAALAFDTAIIYAFIFVFAYEQGTPTWSLVYLPVIEAAVRYGIRGGAGLPIATLPLLVSAEVWRADHFPPPPFDLRHITLPFGIQIIMGLIVGWLAERLRGETSRAEARAAEAEALRDQLGRRADQLEAVNRCARALGSTLDQREAFDRFLRELRSVFEFDRLAIVIAEGDRATVMANSGRAEADLFPDGSSRAVAGSVLERLLADPQTVVSPDMAGDPLFPEEQELARAGLASRAVAPLTLGGEVLGMLSVSRRLVDAFSRQEIDLITLLARQVASAVQNIRTFEAERSAAEELRRLSALRADFVSLVSHELRAPMASIIGCATTLRERWRQLAPDQRESFLALIEQETGRLSTLVTDVLDTSRIEAGTFTYAFGDVDLEELVREATGAVALGQDEISLAAEVRGPLPPVRGDRDRLRQLLVNLLTNAAKYTVTGDEIEVNATSDDGNVEVSVRDHGPGIPAEHQRLVFEKFGRVNMGGKSKPGAGLGLFIARSIAEAHGGSLELSSEVGNGAVFTLRLPAARR
jgi:signal transduction histidine kinase